METYYIIYILLMLTSAFELSKPMVKKVVIIGWCFFLTFFAGLRWGVGPDWDSYLDIFRQSEFDNIFSYDRYGNGELLEPVYVFLNASIKFLFGEYYIFNIFCAGFLQYTYYKASLHFLPSSPIIGYGFIVLFSGLFPARASLATGVLFWAYRCIEKREIIKFLIFMSLSVSIHMKAIIFLPFYWAGKVKLKWYVFIIVYVLIVVLYIQFQQQISLIATMLDSSGSAGERFAKYTNVETEGFNGLSYAGVALNLFLISVYLYLREIKYIKNQQWYNALLNMYLVSMCIYALFSEGMGDLARLATIFTLAQSILLVSAINYFAHHRVFLFRFGAIAFYIAYYVYRTIQATSGYFFKDAYTPYKTIFDYNMSIF